MLEVGFGLGIDATPMIVFVPQHEGITSSQQSARCFLIGDMRRGEQKATDATFFVNDGMKLEAVEHAHVVPALAGP
jgi:hypothetical protein